MSLSKIPRIPFWIRARADSGSKTIQRPLLWASTLPSGSTCPFTSEDVFEFESWPDVVENSNRGLAVRYLHLYEEIADRMHEVLRVLSIMIPTVLKGAIT